MSNSMGKVSDLVKYGFGSESYTEDPKKHIMRSIMRSGGTLSLGVILNKYRSKSAQEIYKHLSDMVDCGMLTLDVSVHPKKSDKIYKYTVAP